MSAVVAIVGRPNVGKSTIFNRLVGKRQAIESNIPGTTRDRIYQFVKLDSYKTLLVDTGGLELDGEGSDLEDNVQEQSKLAIYEADIIIFVVDVRSDLTSEDFHAANLLRKSKKPIVLAANKCDNPTLSEQRHNLYELGFGEPIAMTALHSSGFDELESRVGTELKTLGFEKGDQTEADSDRIRIAFLGRPNVGKSTMINSLMGAKRVVTSKVPGTTRDSTELPFEYKDVPFTLVDTAGLRRRGKIEKGLEKYSVIRTLQAVELADICVLMMDATEGVSNQDCHVSQTILENKKGLILVVNKLDLFVDEERDFKENFLIRQLKSKMAYVPWAPVVFTSALRNKNVRTILDLSVDIDKERKKEIREEDLNIWLDSTLTKHPPKGTRGKQRFDVLHVQQKASNPPEFVFTCEWPEIMHFSYGRYLENALRERFGFGGTGIRMKFKRPTRGY